MDLITRGIRYIEYRYKVFKWKQKFKNDIGLYNRLVEKEDPFQINKDSLMPILHEADEEAGGVDGHYFLQDIYFAKKISESQSKIHYDIGSRIDGFIGHLLSNHNVEKVVLIDIRPFPVDVNGLEFICSDATNLDNFEDNSIESISSLHAIEHFGLGRYGDSIDPNAWKKVLRAISTKLAPGGKFYLGVPISKEPSLNFNGERVFTPMTIIDELKDLSLISFSYIHDYKISNVPNDEIVLREQELGEKDCGLFIFSK